MASVREYKKNDKNETIYRAIACNGRDADGKPNRKSWTYEAKSLTAAIKKGEQLENEWKNAGGGRQPSKDMTLQEFVEKKWMETQKYQKLSPKTQDRYCCMLSHKILPSFGKWQLGEIGAFEIEKFLSDLGKEGARCNQNDNRPYSQKTIQSYYMLLHSLLDAAYQWDMLEKNPCDKVGKPKLVKKKAAYYDEKQVAELLRCLDKERGALEESLKKRNPNHRHKTEQQKRELMSQRRYAYEMLRIFVYLALGSSCRRSELCGLEWTDIDFKTSVMNIQRTAHYSPNVKKYTKDTMKNGESEKSIILPNTVIKALEGYRAVQEQYREIVKWKWIDSNRIFTGMDGGIILPDAMSARFKAFLRKYDLPYITVHQLRHTSISYLLMQNVPVNVVAERAGHRDVSVTTGIYGHVFTSSRKKAAEITEKMFSFAGSTED